MGQGRQNSNSQKQNPTSLETCPSPHVFYDYKTCAVPYFISYTLLPLDLL